MRCLLVCLALSGCGVESLAEDGWPCAAHLPCAAGWTCQDGVCARPGGADSDASTCSKADSDASTRPKADVKACVPDCAAGPCSDDGCGGACPICATLVEQYSFTAPGAEPVGLALGGGQLWIGDWGDAVAHAVTPASGATLGITAALPTEELLRDLAWDGRLLGLTDTALWHLQPDQPPVELAELSASGVAFDGEYVLTLDGATLSRRTPSTLGVFFSTPVKVASNASATCKNVMTWSGDRLFRACGDAMGVPGSYVHRLRTYDTVDKNAASQTAHLDGPMDFRVLTGMAATAETLYLVGRGYGSLDGRVTLMDIVP